MSTALESRQAADTGWHMQEAQLPVADSSSVRHQLDSWGRHVLAVSSGQLQFDQHITLVETPGGGSECLLAPTLGRLANKSSISVWLAAIPAQAVHVDSRRLLAGAQALDLGVPREQQARPLVNDVRWETLLVLVPRM